MTCEAPLTNISGGKQVSAQNYKDPAENYPRIGLPPGPLTIKYGQPENPRTIPELMERRSRETTGKFPLPRLIIQRRKFLIREVV